MALSIASMSPVTSPANDPLADGPPRPNLPNAPGGMRAKPVSGGSGFDLSALSGALVGGPTQIVMRNMMQAEKLIAEAAKYVPQLAEIFAPAIAQARDLAGAGLASIAQGGMGSQPQDTGAPAPAALGPGGPGAPPGLPPMPPPPTPQ